MKIVSTTLLLSVLLPTFCLAGHTATDFDIQWIQDQHVIGVNREAGHATLIPYSSKAALLADEYHKRPWVTPTNAMTIDLNGKWRFRYVPGSNQGPGASEFQAEDYNDERWPLICPSPTRYPLPREGLGVGLFYREAGTYRHGQ